MILDEQFFLGALPKSSIYAYSDNSFSKVNFSDFSNVFDSNSEHFISIDSRTIKEDEIFLALNGPNFDGHNFIVDALSSGAAGVIIEESKKGLLNFVSGQFLQEKPVIVVEDTSVALVEMAKYWRRKFDINVLGVSGSVGKTTTKEMLGSILRTAKIPSYVSYKNQNNIIGLCINILKLTSKHKIAVFELGINAVGEMDELVEVLRPNVAALTCITHAHVGGFGSLENIASEKLKIFKHFSGGNIGVVFGDQQILSDANYNHPVVRFGFKKRNQIAAEKNITFLHDKNNEIKGIKIFVKSYDETYSINLNVFNEVMINNALAAIALSNILGISIRDIVMGLESFETLSGRFEKRILRENKGLLINDCYNASPESMKDALLAFDKLKSNGPKIAVLGDMLELGDKEKFWHKQMGSFLCKATSVDHLILVGKQAETIASTAPLTMKIECVEDWHAAKESLDKLLFADSLVLLKASNAVGLSNIVEQIS